MWPKRDVPLCAFLTNCIFFKRLIVTQTLKCEEQDAMPYSCNINGDTKLSMNKESVKKGYSYHD
jgi:hypothetical protein